MLNLNEMLKDSLNVQTIMDVERKCAGFLVDSGVSSPLAITIIREIIVYSQYSTFKFSSEELQEVIRERKTDIVELFTPKIKEMSDRFMRELTSLVKIEPEKEIEVRESFQLAFESFLTEPEFLSMLTELRERLSDILKNL